MTANELRSHFNRVFGIEKEWPKTYEVDAVTYAHCCQSLFDYIVENSDDIIFVSTTTREYGIRIWLGKNKGLMFKNVELILKS